MFCVTLPCFTYTFDHIWTNLLTQCTQLPVPVFCCFCISGFPAIKSAPKIPEISESRKPPKTPKKGRGATIGTPEGSLARPHPRPCQGASWLPCGPSRCPLRLYLPPDEEPLISICFSRSPLCTAATTISRSVLPGEASPAPCRRRKPLWETIHSHGRLPDV